MRTTTFTVLSMTLLIVLLSACANLPDLGIRSTSPEAAQRLVQENKLAEASAMYASLAQRTDDQPTREHFLLLSAEVLVDNGQYTQGGQERIEAIPETLSAPDLQDRLKILRAKEALISGDAQAALDLLPATNSLYSAAHKARVFEVQANAYARLEQPDEELNARVELDALLETDQAIAKNHEFIWELLEEQPAETLRAMTTKVHGDTYQGWLELALIPRSKSLYARQLTQQVNNWRQRFPGHPASADFAEQLLVDVIASLPEQAPASNIGVLLPLTGNTAKAGNAIRDGLIAAYLESAESSEAPQIHFHDTASGDFPTVYQQALQAGANFIIGPLNKQAVAQLAAEQILPVPTLALNYTELSSEVPQNFFQLGLLPEDEAVSAADRAQQLQYKTALIISPDDRQGERLSTAFRTAMESRGSSVLDTVVLPKDDYDYSEQLRAELHINDSNLRHRSVQSVAGQPLKFEPVIRQDIDLIYLTADARQARLIRPQLLFFRAKDIPLLASSRINDNIVNTQKDRDLNGIVFTDSTWSLNTDTPGNATHAAIMQNWPDSGA
ncbi:MAG: penicillin-binding protein activator, partial [Gammaproteobacteria bacterium]|nr:penicillin-binding protein activator [Gammaproteobacteria bacterium]